VVHHRRKGCQLNVDETLDAGGRATTDRREDTPANNERVGFALSVALIVCCVEDSVVICRHYIVRLCFVTVGQRDCYTVAVERQQVRTISLCRLLFSILWLYSPASLRERHCLG